MELWCFYTHAHYKKNEVNSKIIFSGILQKFSGHYITVSNSFSTYGFCLIFTPGENNEIFIKWSCHKLVKNWYICKRVRARKAKILNWKMIEKAQTYSLKQNDHFLGWENFEWSNACCISISLFFFWMTVKLTCNGRCLKLSALEMVCLKFCYRYKYPQTDSAIVRPYVDCYVHNIREI